MAAEAPRIRVLVVDDSAVARRYLTNAINADPALEVVGTASNGSIGLQKIALLDPQVVTMDIEMPEMSGLQALAAIRRGSPQLPVIMVSSLTELGAVATLEALALGATDYVTKPTALAATGDAEQRYFIRDLVSKLKGLGRPRSGSAPSPARLVPRAPAQPVARRSARIEIVAIGISTGGPNALAELIPTIPADFPVPIVIVQHMPPLFTRLLAERLAGKAAIGVTEGIAGDAVVAGMAIVAPGNQHMVVQRSARGQHIALNQAAQENSCRPAVDVLFRSVSEVYGAGVLAIVMTGMGQDGLLGCEAVRSRGGRVFAQDQKSSVVWGMPGFVVEAGLADEILSLTQLGPAIVRTVRASREAGRLVGNGRA